MKTVNVKRVCEKCLNVQTMFVTISQNRKVAYCASNLEDNVLACIDCIVEEIRYRVIMVNAYHICLKCDRMWLGYREEERCC